MKYFTLLLTLFIFTSCELIFPEPPEPELPPITTTGEDTFGAMVNGVVWLPSSSIQLSSSFQSSKLIDFRAANNFEEFDQSMSFGLNGELVQTGSFDFDSEIFDTRFLNWFDNSIGCRYLRTDENTSFNGQLIISHLDQRNRIVSGTFFFNISKEGCPDVSITDGRFDIKYIN